MAKKVAFLFFSLYAQCTLQNLSWQAQFAYAQCLMRYDPTQALIAWQEVHPHIPDSLWRSIAHNQMGICFLQKKDTLGALRQFMAALRYNPHYTLARHNYEKLKRHLPNPPPQAATKSPYSLSERAPVRDYPISNPPLVNLRYWHNLQVR